MKRLLTMRRIKKICEQKGWILMPYSKAASFFELYKLGKYASKKRAFTFRDNSTGIHYIMYRDSLLYFIKLYVICHEIGHIEKGYLKDKHVSDCINSEEVEADDYATDMLRPNIICFIASLIALVILVISLVINLRIPDNEIIIAHKGVESGITQSIAKTDTVYQSDKIVYITPSGESYHRQNCYHIRGSEVMEISIDKLPSKYQPCKSCLPDDE